MPVAGLSIHQVGNLALPGRSVCLMLDSENLIGEPEN